MVVKHEPNKQKHKVVTLLKNNQEKSNDKNVYIKRVEAIKDEL